MSQQTLQGGGRFRLFLLMGLMAVVAFATLGSGLYVLHDAAIRSTEERLAAFARSQARLIETVYRNEIGEEKSATEAAREVFAILANSYEGWHEGLGRTGEITFARRAGNDIQYLFRRHTDAALPGLVSWNAREVAAPMRHALEGGGGVLVGADYRGVRVVAAYEFIPALRLGVVVKVDLEELQEPLRRAAWHALLAALGLILIASLFFSRIGEGVIRRWREAEQNLAITLDSIGDGVIVTDPRGRVTRMNPVAEALTGWPLAEAVDHPLDEVFSIIHAQTRQPVVNPVKMVIHSGRVVGLGNHTSLIARDGSERQIADSGAPVLDRQGRLQGVVLVFRDVTSEYGFRQALVESEQRLRTVVEQMPVLLTAFDAQGTVVAWNRECERVTGYAAEEVVGRPEALARLYPLPLHREVMLGEWPQREGEPQQWEWEMVAKDGSVHRVAWTNISRRMAIPGWAAWGVGVDVTSLRGVETRLRHLTAMRLTTHAMASLAAAARTPEELIAQACHRLVEGELGCHHAFALLLDRQGRLSQFASAGLPSEQAEALQGALGDSLQHLACLGRILHQLSPVLLQEELADCRGCFAFVGLPDHLTLGVQLVYGERQFGALYLTFPRVYAEDAEFQELVNEVARGIAVALVKMDALSQEEKARQALLESQAKYRELCDNMGSCVAVYATPDHGDTFVFNDFNRAAERVEGVSRHALLGRSVTEVFPGIEEFGLLEVLRRVWRSGRAERHPVSLYRDQRLVGWRENFVYRLASGEVVAIYEDVTERMQAQERLLQSEAKLRALFELMADGLVLCRVVRDQAGVADDFEILELNPAFGRLAGIQEGAGQCFSTLFPLSLRQEGWANALTNAMHGQYASLESDCREWGKRLQVAAYAIGEDRLAIQFRDVTHQRRLDLQLRQAQKMEAIGTLAGGIAHDFNNILGVILGFTELVLVKLPEEDQKAKDLREVYQAGLRARDLVTQLLTFSRRTEQQQQPILLEPMIKETIKFLRAVLPANLRITTQLGEGDLMVMGDPTHIHQILMNLCTNAAHAMEGKGQGMLTVALRRVTLTPEQATALTLRLADYVLLTVSDTGVGIVPEVLPRIFDPFFTTKKVGEGTGLGLSVVHGLVIAAGGAITVSSQPDVGTAFQVYLPLLQTELTPAPTPGQSGQKSRSVLQVLVVDDEPQLVSVLEQQLQRLGCRVTTTTDPEEALQLLQRSGSTFDLVISDQAMPRLTGSELLHRVRVFHPTLPVVLTSGRQASEADLEVTGLGLCTFLPKPVLSGDLAQVVRQVARQSEEG